MQPLQVHRDLALPPLAWRLSYQPTHGTVQARVGTSVVIREDRLFEGCWAGPFEEGEFDQAAIVLGSGAILGPDGLLIVTPSDTHDRVHLLRSMDTVHVTNSLVHLLVATGHSLDAAWPWYPRTYEDLVTGSWHRPQRSLPTDSGDRIDVVQLVNLHIGRDGVVNQVQKREDAEFHDYRSYRDYLSESIRSLLQNASHPDRPRRYGSVQTLSAGYDSPCVAVLTSEQGVREAVTLVRSRPDGGRPDHEDAGDAIAAHLGLSVVRADRNAYLARTDHPEAEFLATGMSGEELPFLAFESQYAGRVVFTGHLGGEAWGDSTGRSVRRTHLTLDATSVGEFRQRLDYIQAPVPSFGLRRRSTLDAIRASAEMEPWRTGGRYDRPFARRTIEEAGIPRGTFAVRKQAVNAIPHVDQTAISRTTQVAIADWWDTRPRPRRAWFGFRMAACRQAALIMISRLTHRAGVAARLPLWIGMPYRNHEHGERSTARFLWAVDRLRARYPTEGDDLDPS